LINASRKGTKMTRQKHYVFGAAMLVSAFGWSPAPAQTFQSYHCADGSQFIVGVFEYDKRAHVQIDGKAVTLAKRVTLSGSRYSGSGVTLRITKAATTIKHARRPVTVCELM
jgi:membrane-bound inhibitor of C-type lysozyme